MSNFFLLLKIRLDEMFEISATFRQSQFSKKVSMIFHRIIMIVLYGVAFFMVFMLANYLKQQGLVETLPIIGYFGAVALTFVMTIIKINETFTGNEDSEFLLSMPFSSATQVFVMFVIMYIRNLLWCVLIELPMYIVYKDTVVDGSLNFAAWLWGLLLTSLPICGIAFMIGMFIILSLVHMPKKNQIVSGIALFVLAIAILLGIVMADRIYMVATGKVSYEGELLATGFIQEICKNFKFGRFYQLGIVKGDVGYIILFSFMSLIWYAVLLFMHTMAYQSVITSLRSPVSYGLLTREQINSRLKENSIFKVLLRKELNQFARSESYSLQSFIGILLGIAIPLNFLVIGTKDISNLQIMIPFLICLFVGISNTTYCGMSMEGKRYWIMEAAPIEKSLLLKAKLALNLIITVPMILFAGVVFGIAFNLSVGLIILYVIIALVYAVIVAYIGNIIGSKFANYNFEQESMIMHRGLGFLLGYLPGVIIPIIGLFIMKQVL